MQSPSAVVMVRPHHFAPNPQTVADNGFQPSAHGVEPDRARLSYYRELWNAT